MTPSQVIKHYGSEKEAAYQLGVTVQAVTAWKKKRKIRLLTQHAIAHITKDALKVDEK